MPLYTDMPSLLEVGGKDFGGTRILTNTDLSRVSARAVDGAGVEVLAETDMSWNADTQKWQLPWITPAAVGTYWVEINGYGINEDKATPAYKRVRIARRPISG